MRILGILLGYFNSACNLKTSKLSNFLFLCLQVFVRIPPVTQLKLSIVKMPSVLKSISTDDYGKNGGLTFM